MSTKGLFAVLISSVFVYIVTGIVIGNAHLGESKEERAESITAIKALVPAEVPTLIQGADTLAEVSVLLSACFGVCWTVLKASFHVNNIQSGLS